MPDRRIDSPRVAAICCAVAIAVPAARAQTCLDYTTYLRLAGAIDTPHVARGIAVSGGFAYVASGDSGLAILDLAIPEAPVRRGRLDTSGDAQAVAVDGGFAYLASGAVGLHVIDISDPDAPVLRSVIDTPGSANAVAVAAGRAYVADHFSGLQILDVTNPDTPAALGAFDTPSIARSVAVAGTVAFVADANAGLFAIDVSNPAMPLLLDSEPAGGDAEGVLLDGTTAWIAGDFAGLRVIDVSTTSALTTVATYPASSGARRLARSGSHLFVARQGTGLQILDITNPLVPVEVGVLNTFGSALEVAIASDFAYVADQGHGVVAVDISNPQSPPIASSAAALSAGAITRVEGRLFTACGVAGMQIFDATDPLAPVPLTTFDTPGSAQDVEVSGNVAYIADGTPGLHAVDISNPAAPLLLSTAATGYATAVTVAGSLAFVGISGGTGGALRIVDVANPAALTVVGSLDLPQSAFDVQVRGDHVFVADFTADVKVVDVSNPSAPILVTTLVTPDYSTALEIDGDLMVVGDAQFVLVVEIADPANPVITSAVESADQIWALALRDDIVYVANGLAGVQVIDVSDAHAPVHLGTVSSLHDVQDVVLGAGPLVYAATRNSGIRILETQCPATTDLNAGRGRSALRIAAFPNPSTAGTRIVIESRTEGAVDVDLYDAAGRWVRNLARRSHGGAFSLAWDGADTNGRRTAPGVYFATLRTTIGRATTRLVRMH
jgi:hypothetical protein